MKKIDELMKELGFTQNAPQSAKEAFIKHLIKASTGVNLPTPSEKEAIKAAPDKVFNISTPLQLSFDFDEIDPAVKHKKAVS